MKLIARELVGVNAISMQSGKNLYDKISTPIISNNDVELDFDGIEVFASPFFNASIGLLLKDVEIGSLLKHLKIINLNPVGRNLLNHVISNAIKYYEMGDESIGEMKEIIKDNNE